MELSTTDLMEISFNIVYLIIIYIFVIFMTSRLDTSQEKNITKRFLLAFFLLALGDTGHVGFRVIAFLNGGLENNSLLVGFGALSTAITITFFYLILLDIWCIEFKKPKDPIYYGLITVGIIRFVIMAFPQNDWGRVVPVFEWSLLRNIPLMIIGLSVAYFMIRDGLKEQDYRYRNFGLWILVSYLFYLPVILFVQIIPIIGMLMIPKTIAYLVMAWLSFKYYFSKNCTR